MHNIHSLPPSFLMTFPLISFQSGLKEQVNIVFSPLQRQSRFKAEAGVEAELL